MGKASRLWPRVLRILDLCSGTQSLGKAAKFYKSFFNYASVDIKSIPLPTFCDDLFHWKLPAVGSYDVVWFSPDCAAYSILQHAKPELAGTLEARRQQADRLVRRGVNIILHIKPKWFFIENPETGALKGRNVIPAHFKWFDVSYCHYGYPYRKYTRIWTNLKGFRPKFCRSEPCWQQKLFGKHISQIGCDHRLNPSYNSVPGRLLMELLELMIQEHVVSTLGFTLYPAAHFLQHAERGQARRVLGTH